LSLIARGQSVVLSHRKRHKARPEIFYMSKRKMEQAENKQAQEAQDQESFSDREMENMDDSGEESRDLNAELEAARAEATQNYDKLLRLSAEFENYKKRMQRQVEEYRKFANESLIKDLLSVVDNLERAMDASAQSQKESDQCMMQGLEMTLEEIRKVLKKYHVTPVEAMGKPFDPAFHEAVMQQPTDDCPDNTVIQEMQKGYMLHDRLIRPAMVVVSRAPA
jgi:molecular chaperone GrpE